MRFGYIKRTALLATVSKCITQFFSVLGGAGNLHYADEVLNKPGHHLLTFEMDHWYKPVGVFLTMDEANGECVFYFSVDGTQTEKGRFDIIDVNKRAVWSEEIAVAVHKVLEETYAKIPESA